MRGLPRSLQRAAARAAGTPASRAGLRIVTEGDGAGFKTTLTFNAMPVAITDALAHAGVKLMDFAGGKIRIKGGTARLAFAVLTARAATINDNASLTWGLGSAAASAAALAGAMVDVLAIQTKVLSAAGAAFNTNQAADATAVTLDGTVTDADLYLNLAFAVATDIDGDGTLALSGQIVLVWENWGDNV